MSGPVGVLDRVVIFCALIGVLDQERDRRSGRHLALGFFVMKNAGEDFDLIGLLPLGCEARGAGTPLFEKSLDVAFFERDQRRAAIDHAADRGTMAFAKSRHPEEMAEGVMGHGLKSKERWRGLSTANDPRDGKGGGGGKRTDDRRLQGAAERRDAGQLAFDAAEDQ